MNYRAAGLRKWHYATQLGANIFMAFLSEWLAKSIVFM